MTDPELLQADLHEFLEMLGLPLNAQSRSPHDVFQEALGVLRDRLNQAVPRLTAVARGSQDSAAVVYFEGSITDDNLTEIHKRVRTVLPCVAGYRP